MIGSPGVAANTRKSPLVGGTMGAQPVEGIIGVPAPLLLVVRSAPAEWAAADLRYHTGIR